MPDAQLERLAYLLSSIGVLFLVYLVIKYGVRAGMRTTDKTPKQKRRLFSPPIDPGVRAISLSYDANKFSEPETLEVRGPTTFVVKGVDKSAKQDMTIRVTAESEANAKVKAELDGMIVTSVDPTWDD